MKIEYRAVKLSKANKERLITINQIIESYRRQGYVLTLRQLYYQLVTKNIIANQVKEYSKLSVLLREGRMAGIVDWEAIEDRLRVPSSPNAFGSPEEAMQTIIDVYRRPRLEGQSTYVEVWVEKDALSGVIKRATNPYNVPVVVNRGYSSATAMHDAFQRFQEATIDEKQNIVILYLGDFDPSGVDMIRDIRDRINEFDKYNELDFEIKPIALTEAQIRKYNPPPNPAKITDPRAGAYIAKYGPTSWEVDALNPEILNALITSEIKKIVDLSVYNDVLEVEKEEKEKLENLKEQL